MRFYVFRIFLAFLILPVQIWSQTPGSNQTLENQLELQAQSQTNAEDISLFAEQIENLKNNPISINFAEPDQLAELPFLDVFKVHNLIQYRKATGGILTPYELLQIKGFDQKLIEQITPFLDFNPEQSKPRLDLNNILSYSRHHILGRYWRDLELRKGFTTSSEQQYLGAPNSYYLRYRSTYKNILSIGLNLQQDAGEPFNSPLQNTAIDYVSYHFALTNYGNLKSFVIGDFHVEFGQGLNTWTGFNRGKNIFGTEVKKYARGFRPHMGSEENRFLKGVAATYRLNKVDVSTFYSNKKIDANVLNNVNFEGSDQIGSLQNTGLHRTIAELEDRHSLKVKMLGAMLEYHGNMLDIGLSGNHVSMNPPIQLSENFYQKFQLSGSKLGNLSVDFDLVFKDLNLFGEFAYSSNNAFAGLLGLQSKPSDELRFNTIFRHFSPHYQSLYNAPFSERSSSGERGIYTGLIWDISKLLQINTFMDLFEFSWPLYNSDFPTYGYETGFQLDFNFSRYFKTYVRYQHEMNQVNGDVVAPLSESQNQSLKRFRIHLNYSPQAAISLKSRLELSSFNQQDQGFLIFQDVQYRFSKIPLQCSFRYALINTDSYASRIYSYENDLQYLFSVPAYFGKSSRLYALLRYSLTQKVKLELKYSLTHYKDRNTISSGLNEINSSALNQIKFQFQFKF